MAETVGLVIGAVGLAALFDSCMSAFSYIESGTNYGAEYQQMALRIALLQLRLSRWKQPIQLVDNALDDATPSMGRIQAKPDEAEQVQELLGWIHDSFQQAEKISKRFKMENPAPGSAGSTVPTDGRNDIETLTKRVQNLALDRQKRSNFGHKARWALHDKSKFLLLVTNLKSYIDDLAELFPVIHTEQEKLAVADVAKLISDEDTTVPANGDPSTKLILQGAAADVDELLGQLIANLNVPARAHMHDFKDMETGGKADAFFGDYVEPGSTRDNGPGHNFVRVKATGDARVRYGNTFGGGDPMNRPRGP